MSDTKIPAINPEFARPIARLLIDLDALAKNYRTLCDRVAPARVAGVMKADAYGLGASRIAPVLHEEGCRAFYVAHAFEGVELRAALGDRDADIYLLNGFWPGELAELRASNLIPVINELAQLDSLRENAPELEFCLHFDTGMNRLGLGPAEAETLLAEPQRLEGLRLRQILSHLASADDPGDPMNRRQRDAFARLCEAYPGVERSFANSAGVLLGADYAFDMVRPGLALLGGDPAPGHPHPFDPVVEIEAPILQIRDIPAGETVGYGGHYRADRPRRIATVLTGYADGLLRNCCNGGTARINRRKIDIIGRVSMDYTAVDINDVTPAPELGDSVRFLGPDLQLMAEAADSIPFELLVRLSHRLKRVYIHKGEEQA